MDPLKAFSNHSFNSLNIGPLAAQSLELPLPYSAPAKTIVS
ncbi:hypothetical protein Hanom_Chr03g00230701 [Helianthus anomalus]